MSATSGLTSATPFAFYDPDSRCLRTSQATFLWDSTPSSPTLPPSGSMSSGRLYERATLGPATADSDCSSSLPTPTARDHKDGAGTTWRPEKCKLPHTIGTLLPTPTAQAAKHATDDRGPGSLDDFNLWSVATRMMPTPTARLGTPRGAQAKRYVNPERSNDLDDAVAWLGATSDQPSSDTPDSPDEPPHGQLTIEDA